MSTADQLEMFWWVLLAMGLGGLVGLERELRGHEAGVRTNALVCAGAAIFGQVSVALDDTRIAAGVVQGIGFLGAGLVFQRGNNVHGITTAATVWVMAAIGLLIGAHVWLLPVLLTVTLIIVLEAAPGSDAILRFSRRRGLAHGDALPSDEEPGPDEEREEASEESKSRQ